LIALLLLAAGELAGLGLPVSALGAAILGLGLPKFVVGVLAKRRVGQFGGQFPDAIDIIVRGIRSGLPLAECIGIISSEMSDPIGAEFRSIVEAQKLGMSLQSAVARAVIRMPIADLRYFSIVIAIQQQTGGNLAETLAKLSDVLRGRKRMRDKIAAYASEARASALIIGSLPIVVILALAALAPHYIGLLFSTDLGNVLLAVGAITEVSGVWVMRKMINFDI
jgi:tight adherence protein B